MKKIIKTSLICLIFLLIINLTNITYAASFSVSSSATSVTKGKTFTITINGGSVTGRFNLSSSSNISLSKTSIWVENGKVSITATAKSAGTGSVTVTATDVADSNGNEVTGSRTVSIKVTEPATPKPSPSIKPSPSVKPSPSNTPKPTTNTNNNNTSKPKEEVKKSSDSTLKGLEVKEGKITPEFNKDVREYFVSVPNEVTEVNVIGKATHEKATIGVTGNTDLKEGENTVTVSIKAEDGSTSKYLIRVNRSKPKLSLNTLTVKYKNQNGELIELKLNPAFNFETYEYTLEDLEYWVKELEIEAVANIKEATIKIEGADNLVQGENTVIITVKNPISVEEELPEDGEVQEEIITYTIKFNKKQEIVPPTIMGRTNNWFNGIFGGISSWYIENQNQIIFVSLNTCIVALIGLSIYMVIDYKKYKDIITKIKKINELNNLDKSKENTTLNSDTNLNVKANKPKAGKHF